ncbi:DUF2197 domain-containing protein [Hazenella coriacea]|uniref:DUF2197 domain-containing protein n=1 Tax=Hazenella coriacea TaxID=1179467 RepID=UPI00105382DA
MRVVCILCDQSFVPDKLTQKKLIKHPHRIQICPNCYERITKQVLERKKQMYSSFEQLDATCEISSHSND